MDAPVDITTLATSIFATLQASFLFDLHWWAAYGLPALLAILTPTVAIRVNHAVRLNRLKSIQAFARNFLPLTHRGGPGTAPRYDIRRTPSFEFATSKYIVDLDEALPPEHFRLVRQAQTFGHEVEIETVVVAEDGTRSVQPKSVDMEYLINRIRCFQLWANRRIVWQSSLYIILVAIGFHVVFTGLYDAAGPKTLPNFLIGTKDVAACGSTALTIYSVAFLGGYLSSLTIIARAVAAFDLSGVTMLRVFLHLSGSILWAVVIWHFVGTVVSNCETNNLEWLYVVMFFVGFVPDAGMRYVSLAALNLAGDGKAPDDEPLLKSFLKLPSKLIGAVMRSIKVTDGRFTSVTKSIPLDVIDGIDFFTRFRLEQAGIFEVQNLATANPILLHVETPFGIYQLIDWVGQAQLCSVVGTERFLMLRQYNLRTVFDLERAVLSLKTTSELRRIVAGIMAMTTEEARRIEELSGSRMVSLDPKATGSDLSLAEFGKIAVDMMSRPGTFRERFRPMSSDDDPGHTTAEYSVWPRKMPPNREEWGSFAVHDGQNVDVYDIFETADPDATIKQMVRIIMDDLHVMRLRQIWESIHRRLTEDAATLDDSEDTYLGA